MAGKMTFNELMRLNKVGGQALQPFFGGLGINEWRTTGGGVNDAGETQYFDIANPDAEAKANGYTFDFTANGPANTGYLTAYDPSGSRVGNFQQQDITLGQSLMDWGKIAAIGFGGAGLAGLGPLAGLGGFGASGVGGADAGITAAMEAGASGFTPEALAAWGGSAGVGTGEAALAGVGGGGAAGLGSLGGMDAGGYALASDAAGSMAPELLAANGVDAAALGYSGGIPGMSGSFWGELGKAAIGPALSTGLQMFAANKASNAQQDATNSSNALQKYVYDTTRSDNMPALEARNSALGQMQALLKDPSSLTAQPGYQFGLDQGTKTLNNGAAARGMTYSGAQGKALQRYGQDYAGTKLDQSFNRLSALASGGQQGAGTIANASQNYGSTVGNNLTAMGDANAAKYLVNGQAVGNAVNGLTAYGQRQGWWGGN